LLFYFMSNITPNQREAIAVIDDLNGDTFYVGGNAATKSVNVNITGDIVIGNINLAEVGGASVSLGQKTSANSLPVTIASDQSSLNINNISGTISLPTGAANQTKQDTGNTSLASIDGKTPALGQALAAGSVPVVLTAAQLSTLTPLSTVAATQSGNWSTRTLDGSGNTIGSTSNALDVNIKSATSIVVSGTVAATQSGTWNVGLNAGSNAIGSITNTSFGATQVTAANLNATVVGTGTFATQLTANPLVAAPLVGQSKIAVSGTAVNLNGGTSQPLTNGIIITAPAGNVAPIAIGGSGVNNTSGGTGNGYQLASGASVSFAVTNTNDIWINGTNNDYVSWAGS
jgi:hypothetical protein